MMPLCPTGPHTHSLTEACALIGCGSESWLTERVHNGTFPGRRIVRDLRFSDDDIAQIINACAIKANCIPTPTARSRRRHAHEV
jgi:hypothetical protein